MSLHCSQFSLGRLLPPEGEIGKGIRTSAVTKTKRPGVKENVKSAVTRAAAAKSGGRSETDIINAIRTNAERPAAREIVKNAVTGEADVRNTESASDHRLNGNQKKYL